MKEADHSSLPKRWGTVRPKVIISLVAILAFLGIVVGYFEISQSRKNVMGILRREGETVTDALSISAENALQAYAEIEEHIEKHLFNSGLLLNHLFRETSLSQPRFEKFMRESGVARAFFVTSEGLLREFAYPPNAFEDFATEAVRGFLEPLFSENLESTSGLLEDENGEVHFVVALRSMPKTAWLLCENPGMLLDLRRRVGIGGLIQDIGENAELAYIVLQDEQGILAATRNVSTMGSIRSDPLSLQVISSKQSMSRVTEFEGDEVFETVKPFIADGEALGLIRVALKMDAVNQAVARTIQRAVAVVLGFIVIGLVLFNFLVTHQSYELLNEAYSKIKTYTGNILENMADAVVAVNRDGRITLFNRAAEKLFGKSSERAIGKSCSDIIGKQTSLLDRTLVSGTGVRDEEVEYQLGDQKAVLSVTTNLLRDKTGEIDSAVAVVKDLTEKKVWEERLRRQEKLTAMGELASGVAHEIRNPLNAVSIIAQRFAHEFTPSTNVHEYQELANSVVSATRQVSSIIERFLQFARPPELNLEKQSLNEVVQKAVTLVESQGREKGVTLRFEADGEILLPIDGQQMADVFVNLLQNSLHATPANGTICVRLYQSAREAVVEIADTGVGIPPQHINKIFDLYFTTKKDGTGMGLSISHRIVSEHGGRMDVNSEVGRGTTFKIYLPIVETE